MPAALQSASEHIGPLSMCESRNFDSRGNSQPVVDAPNAEMRHENGGGSLSCVHRVGLSQDQRGVGELSPVTSAYRHTRPIAATHSITEDTWMAHVGSESALAGSSLTSRPAAAAGPPCDSSDATATAVTTAAVAPLLSDRLVCAAASSSH